MEYEDSYNGGTKKAGKQHNTLPIFGNESSMNLNPLILANIQGSSYFKVSLFKLKTYHEVVDEIYYQVKHLEPWERGSRKTSGQTGMCGGVRGVGAGGIVSTAYCLLYKLYTLRLTRKQVNGLLNHTDSPYIRGLGFMYLRYTQPPADLYDWYEDYLQDEEEIDVKAGGGQVITIGQMAYQLLTKLDWFATLFPRIPVPIQKQIEKKIENYSRTNHVNFHQASSKPSAYTGNLGATGGGSVRDNGREDIHTNSFLIDREYRRSPSREVREYRREPDAYPADDYDRGDKERERYRSREGHRSHKRRSGSASPNPEKHRREKHKKKHKKHRDRSRSKHRDERSYGKPETSDRYKEREYDKYYR